MKSTNKYLSRLAVILTVVAFSTHNVWADEWDEEEGLEGGEGDLFGEEEEEEQPPVYAGGLYNKSNYPIASLQRPLTLNRKMLEIRGQIEADISKGVALESWYMGIGARYGVTDTLEVQGEFRHLVTGAAPLGTQINLGAETSIVYDLVDFRATLEVPVRPCCETNVSFGVPFRYRPKKEVAIIALERIMTFHLEGGTPDLTLGVGGIFQPHPIVAVLVRGQLILPDFEPDLLVIPVEVAVQLTPTRMVDLGLAFTLGNIKDENDRFASRSIMLFGQIRL